MTVTSDKYALACRAEHLHQIEQRYSFVAEDVQTVCDTVMQLSSTSLIPPKTELWGQTLKRCF